MIEAILALAMLAEEKPPVNEPPMIVMVPNERQLYWSGEAWEVRIDRSIAGGCFMLTMYPDGTGFTVGFDPRIDSAYIIMGNQKWKSLELGKEYSLDYIFDDDTAWNGNASAVKLSGDTVVLRTYFRSEEFLLTLAKKLAFRVEWNGQEIGRYRLNGSPEAIVKMLECQGKIEDERELGEEETEAPAVDDPFKT